MLANKQGTHRVKAVHALSYGLANCIPITEISNVMNCHSTLGAQYKIRLTCCQLHLLCRSKTLEQFQRKFSWSTYAPYPWTLQW